MNSEIKRHIDSARQVLVGVVPNPTSQIDQITNALIYKFMDDMDQASIKAGGKPSFFVGELEKYSWTVLMGSRLGNQERMNLYGEALTKFSQSEKLPELFREIFKSAFLPYRSPEVLGLFLKEIDYFDYAHPEDLGDAYEYLLSIMSSQGDAGQFRTPRHIIDFIVDVVNPTKDDKILDPACGTAGFLISAFKHILSQHDGKDDTESKEKELTPDQRKTLMSNLYGYDVDPGMVRIAQVNMYLHGFKNPKIYQYDTLAMEERWNDKFDVILANPPFMSPKGGIRPHKKFGVESNRSEVLFVDYIMNHLRPKGRAGIIVPEGIIFQSGKAYKQLRKNLINDGLFVVVSLPSGVFNPYAGVKTSILLFDNELAKTSNEILFVKVENDGYSLGAQRKKIENDDLPDALSAINSWKDNKKIESKILNYVEKEIIAKDGDYNLSGDRYRIASDYTNAKWPMVIIEDVISTVTPPVKILKQNFKKVGSFPIIDQSQEEVAGWTNDEATLVKSKQPLVIFGDHTCAVKYSERYFAQGADGIKILLTNEKLLPKYLYYVLRTNPIKSDGYKRHFSKLKRTEVPLPPLEVQEQIVKELDGYQKIIDGAKQISENWKPKIDIDPEWEKVKLGEVFKIESGGTPSSVEPKYWDGNINWATLVDIPQIISTITETRRKITQAGLRNSSAKLLPKGTVCVSSRATIGRIAISGVDMATNQGFKNVVVDSNNDPVFVAYMLNEKVEEMVSLASGGTFKEISKKQFSNLIIPLPSLEIQKLTVEEIEAERELVESAKKLIGIYEGKTKKVIDKLWEE